MTSLAAYAASDSVSLGRKHEEAAAPSYYSNEYQRDRDRIIHSVAFQRLGYKTQVFLVHEGELFRTRLAHVLEVAQISRLVARALHLNEDLVEAIAFAQDLGHTPWGHSGQDSLNQCLKEQGGFEHSFQSLRIVDELEEKFPRFRGLNLTFETREGVLKHCAPKQAQTLGQLGARFLTAGLPTPPTLEAQLIHLCDEMVYQRYDIIESLHARLISMRQLREQPLFEQQYRYVTKNEPSVSQRRTLEETLRRIMNEQLNNLIETSRDQLEAMQPKNIHEVRHLGEPLITFSALFFEKHLELKQFLQTHVYQHYRLRRMAFRVWHMIQRLFEAFYNDPSLLPLEAQMEVQRLQHGLGSERGRARAIGDYIASMTDRLALSEYERLFSPTSSSQSIFYF